MLEGSSLKTVGEECAEDPQPEPSGCVILDILDTGIAV